jgi:Na+/phosphate symporter
MRQINFVMIFVISLALVLFGIENTEPARIRIVEGLIEVQAPLSVELIIAMGIGAVLAWIFSVWVQVQRLLLTQQEMRERDTRIEGLEQDIERYKAEVEEQRLLPSAEALTE